MIRSDSDVEEILKPYAGRIRRCIEKGFSDALIVSSTVASALEKRTRAGINRDLIVDEIAKEFESVPRIALMRKRGLLLINVEEKLSIRIKKMDSAGRCSNYPTQQALNFAEQLSLDGEGYDEPTNLNVGYVPDSTGTEILQILAACPNGGRNEWVISLEATSEVSPFVTLDPTVEQKDRIKIKDSETKEKKDGSKD